MFLAATPSPALFLVGSTANAVCPQRGQDAEHHINVLFGTVQDGAEAAISAIYKIEVGAPRAVLYCAKQDIDMVLGTLPALRADGIGCAAYKEQRGGGRGRKEHGAAPPKAKQAELGLRDASRRRVPLHDIRARMPAQPAGTVHVHLL